MAITLADFTKIWASTSPLTPYSFSESNYKEGWNFIGGTPPSRQMWDSIQNQNDEKLKYIVDNFLPLSGGTMTGDITLDGGAIVGNPLTLTADDGNGNEVSLVANPNGDLTWGGNTVPTTNSLFASVSVSGSVSISANNFGQVDVVADMPTGYHTIVGVVEVTVNSPLNLSLCSFRAFINGNGKLEFISNIFARSAISASLSAKIIVAK